MLVRNTCAVTAQALSVAHQGNSSVGLLRQTPLPNIQATLMSARLRNLLLPWAECSNQLRNSMKPRFLHAG